MFVLLYFLYNLSRKNIITLHINVTLEEIYNKEIKKIVLTTKDEGFSTKQTILYLSLLNYETSYVFKGMGDLNPDSKQKGDVVIVLKIIPHDEIHIDTVFSKYDLIIERKMTLFEYYYETAHEIDYFNKTKLYVSRQSSELRAVVKNAGLPYYDFNTSEEKRGNLYVYWKLDLPVESPRAMKELLKKYFHK